MTMLSQLPTLTPEAELILLTVRWGVTVPTGGYTSARLDAEASVPPDANGEEVLQRLKSWVGQNSPASALQLEEMALQVRELRAEKRILEDSIEVAREKWRQVTIVFDKLGIPLPEDVVGDLPF